MDEKRKERNISTIYSTKFLFLLHASAFPDKLTQGLQLYLLYISKDLLQRCWTAFVSQSLQDILSNSVFLPLSLFMKTAFGMYTCHQFYLTSLLLTT